MRGCFCVCWWSAVTHTNHHPPLLPPVATLARPLAAPLAGRCAPSRVGEFSVWGGKGLGRAERRAGKKTNDSRQPNLLPTAHHRTLAAAAAPATAASIARPPRDAVLTGHPANNVPESVYDRMGAAHHITPAHPICIIKDAIHAYFDGDGGRGAAFDKLDDLPPVVPAASNFDAVLVPPDHVSRSPNDTYYVDDATVLRCHTSAHQADLLASGRRAFLVTGDVYRRDTVDASHYPVFHQMEGVRVFEPAAWGGSPDGGVPHAEAELKATLEGLAAHLFGADAQTRWVDAYFPFTHPSFELEVFFNGEWLEVLGCGVVQPAILNAAGIPSDHTAWAFGLGLERLAMVLFDIPDIRLFWSADKRFTSQFAPGNMRAKFKPFSKFPPCFKDVSFWQPTTAVSENDVCEIVRSVAGDLAESVALLDAFTHPKTGRASTCYRIAYRSMERSLEDDEVNVLQDSVRERLAGGLGVELR